MKLKGFLRNSCEKDPREPLPQRASLSLQIHLTTVSDTAGFYTTPEGPGAGYPRLLNQHELKCLATPLAIAPSAGDNIRASRTPSRPDAAPALRSRGSLRCPTWANNPGCIGCARPQSPGHMRARCRLAPTRRTSCL